MLTKNEIDEIHRTRNDREMILHPEAWVSGNVLFVKRPTGVPHEFPEVGMMVGWIPKYQLTVFLGTIIEFNLEKKLEYKSIEELLADGWVVD